MTTSPGVYAGRYANARSRQQVVRNLGISPERVRCYDYHQSHAAAYFAPPFNCKRALVMVLDGKGDNFSASVFIADRGHQQLIARPPRRASLGLICGFVTVFLGMQA